MLGLVGEVAVAVAAANLAGVLPPGGCPLAVAGQDGRVGDPELGGQVRHRAGRHGGRIGQEGAEETHRAELRGQTEAVVVAAAIGEQRAVGLVEVEIAGELGGRRLPGVAPVAPLLLDGEENDRHGPAPPSRPGAAAIAAASGGELSLYCK